MWLFAEFWYNRLTQEFMAGPRVAFNVPLPICRFIVTTKDFFNKPFDSKDFDTIDEENSNTDDYLIIKNGVEHCFRNVFLPFLRNKFMEENL